jgi:hypothetical protein
LSSAVHADQLIQLTVLRAVPICRSRIRRLHACSTNTNGKPRRSTHCNPVFYVGALVRQTQRRRVEVLEALGATPEELARLKAPIGLFPSQDPRSLAMSALAEIVKIRTASRGGAQ